MDPARTAVYTLSLHDALPILLVVAGAELKSERRSKSLSRPWPSTGAAVAAPSRVAVLRTPIVRMNLAMMGLFGSVVACPAMGNLYGCETVNGRFDLFVI